MNRQKVTDPALLAQLGESPRQKVTDPKLLAQLNGTEENEGDAGAYLDTLPQPEGFFHKLPRNIVAGLAKLGHSTINTPHDVVQGFEHAGDAFGAAFDKALPLPKAVQEKLDSMPKQKPFKLSEHIPYQQEYDFAQMLGQKGEGTLMDKLIQKGVEYAPELVGGGALLRGGVRRLKGTHYLDKVERTAQEKGLSNFNYPPDMIKEAKKFLPNTEATKELINQVNAGKYKPAFDLQSQVGHHQRKLMQSPLASENSIMAPKAGELKQNMLGHLESVLRNSNHIKEADLLRKGINNYRQYTKVKKAVMPLIKYLGIPTTILGALSLGYNKGKQAFSD